MKRSLAFAGASALAVTMVAVPQAAASPRTDLALEWYDVTAAAVTASGVTTQVTNSRTWAVSWLAAAKAVRASRNSSFQRAAFVTALHDSLVALYPGQKSTLDARLATSLKTIKPGKAKQQGVKTGHKKAVAVLKSRAGDGLDEPSVQAPWTPPAAAPGVWQPTPPAYAPAVQSGQGKGRTFLLGRASRFRPGPPPAIDSKTALRDLAEVRDYGSIDSTKRTAKQTDVAKLWAQPSLSGYTQALRAAVAQKGSLARRSGLVAVFHVVSIDAQIAVYEAKYHYTAWRPVTVLRQTIPGWTPLIVTPAHPEYPSGHTTYAGAAEAVLTAYLGKKTKPFTLTSPATAPGVTLTYTNWSQLTRDNINARVWDGVHFRNTDKVGAALGAKVADYDLKHLSKLF